MFQGYDIRGAFQPDSIKVFTSGGRTFMATANEGDAKVESNCSMQLQIMAEPWY